MLDLGAGGGALTRALADAGARVRAVELDPAALRQLETRFGRDPRVEVVEGDATLVPLPSEPFAVVANLPFAVGTAILRRLLGDPRVPLTQLDAIVEWGLAAKRTAVWPSTLLGCTLGSVVRAEPRPARAAQLLRAAAERRRRGAARGAAAGAARPRREEAAAYEALLRRAFDARAPLDRILPRGLVHRAALELGFDPHAAARDLDVRQWSELYAAVRSATPRRRAAGARRRRGSRR